MENYKKLIYLVYLDILTTTMAIYLGGSEYNPISMFVMKQSYLLFIIVKIMLIYLIYLIAFKTNIFKEVFGKILLYTSITIFFIIVCLNTIYIITKIIGVI